MSTNIQKQNRKSNQRAKNTSSGGFLTVGIPIGIQYFLFAYVKLFKKLAFAAAGSTPMMTDSKTSSFSLSDLPQNYDKQLVGLDWLDLKISDEFSHAINFDPTAGNRDWLESSHSKGVYSLELKRGNQSYRQGAIIRFAPSEAGMFKIGELYWDGMFADIKGTAKLHIENQRFYLQIPGHPLIEVIEDLVALLKSKVLGVIRADIAFDSLDNGLIVHKLASGKVTPVKQDSLGILHSKMYLGARKELGFTMGSRNYGRYVRFYNKSAELNSNKDKDKGMRIRENWFAHGLQDNTADVYRIEFELKHNYLKKLKRKKVPGKSRSLDWKDFFDHEGLNEIASIAAKNFLDFVPTALLGDLRGKTSPDAKKQAHKVLEAAKKAGKCVKVIDFSKVKTTGYNLKQALPTPPTSRAQQLAAKQLIVSAALNPDDKKAGTYKAAAAQLMQDNQLQNYIAAKNHHWSDFISREAKRRDVSINQCIDLTNIAQSLQNTFCAGIKILPYSAHIPAYNGKVDSNADYRKSIDYLLNAHYI